MRSAILFAGAAAGSLLCIDATVASSPFQLDTHSSVASDQAICAPILSKLRAIDSGRLLAQAAPPAQSKSGADEAAEKPDEDKLATELSAMLQACSYDGKALAIKATALETLPDADGTAAVAKIMRYTGLPQNFTIVQSDVPNAAALVAMGKDGVPRRVIAYNREFMRQMAKATGEAAWSETSILAHEIGHHLSGHTLLPGGSQPPIELEADKFSGFVLFKMGASLPQAEKAVETLIPEEDGPTHPGRQKRLAAINAGWMLSCEQQQDGCRDDKLAASKAETDQPSEQAAISSSGNGQPLPSSSAMPDIPGEFDIDIPKAGDSETLPPRVDRIPVLPAEATPSKFDRFVYDDVGVFDPDVRKKLEQTAFQFAAATNVEIVTVVVKDLQGRDPNDYALAFMRQMRVGKLDVGNGAVLLVAPNEKAVGVALGAGLRVLFENDDSISRRLNDYLEIVDGGGKPQRVSSTIAGAAYRVMRQAAPLEWVVRYPDFAAYEAADKKVFEERSKATTPYDPAKDPVAGKLLRLDASVVAMQPDQADRKLMINEPRSRYVGPAVQVRTPDGKDIVLYVNRSVPALMPVPLEEGKRYAFIARDTILRSGAPQLDLISYDLIE